VKRLLTCVLALFPVLLLAAGPGGGPHTLFVNGKRIGDVRVIRGIIAVSVADVAKAAGSSMTLEPQFALQGKSFTARPKIRFTTTTKDKVEAYKTAPPAAGGSGNTSMQDIHFAHSVDKSSPLLSQAFQINKEGPISTHVLMDGGAAFIPLSDLARALGGTFTAPAGGLAPGAQIQLNIPRNLNAVLVAL
jgi:hypothetical protein